MTAEGRLLLSRVFLARQPSQSEVGIRPTYIMVRGLGILLLRQDLSIGQLTYRTALRVCRLDGGQGSFVRDTRRILTEILILPYQFLLGDVFQRPDKLVRSSVASEIGSHLVRPSVCSRSWATCTCLRCRAIPENFLPKIGINHDGIFGILRSNEVHEFGKIWKTRRLKTGRASRHDDFWRVKAMSVRLVTFKATAARSD